MKGQSIYFNAKNIEEHSNCEQSSHLFSIIWTFTLFENYGMINQLKQFPTGQKKLLYIGVYY
ncbi:hypothetical protein MPS01_20280 [Marinilactibacillus psychrotolerans]|uniref:Uncharacterized protein n=1 Tax=Marinilactibacillus psychrotolerans TaxID=191770 RepID=A0AAV3WWJ0_9LACT|nr:hypothetical protein MPS01_20280 [Marinilactibacillus psychrotolerans]GEQ36613.1 hypothetical protein M132T_21210 [Marinilactibacillus psychrotolerans]